MTDPTPERETSPPAHESPAGRAPLPAIFVEALRDAPLRFAVLLFAMAIFLPGLGSFGLWDPWEGHYGEVGRQMIERGDWISPWWGSHWEVPGKRAEGAYFFSKPVLLLWMMGIGMLSFGFSELGIRIGVALIAILAVVAVYMAGEKVWNRRVGVLMAVALGTSPFFTMLGRQAQTDMPFVGLMTVAMAFFLMAMFGRDREAHTDKLSWGVLLGFLALVALPQYHTITVGQLDWRSNLKPIEAFFCYGPTQLAIYLLMLGVVGWTLWRSPKPTTRRQLYLFAFYAFIGLATMAKGLLGFALPGAIICLYLVVTREWWLLAKAEIPRGVLLCVAVGFPWYGAMFARHGGIGGAFWDRFIIHDHFRRLAEGVHQTDTGSFEHFMKWLGYGLFPWGSLLPVVLVRAFTGESISTRSDQDRARLFLLLWFAVALTLFTLSSTKFHHYIFPAVPPLALLAALAIDDLWERRLDLTQQVLLGAGALVLFGLVAFDLARDPQHFKNLFTYKYDRRWDAETWNPPLLRATLGFIAAYTVAWLLLFAGFGRRVFLAGVWVLGVSASLMAVWLLNVYMPTISPTWSQRELWDHYYSHCTRIDGPPGAHPMKRYCEEPVLGYRLNWRGENFYTQNEILPIRDDDEWNHFWSLNEGRCFYAFTFKGRYSRLRSQLPEAYRDTVEVVHSDNLKFDLVRAACDTPENVRARRQADEPEPAEEDEQDSPRN